MSLYDIRVQDKTVWKIWTKSTRWCLEPRDYRFLPEAVPGVESFQSDNLIQTRIAVRGFRNLLAKSILIDFVNLEGLTVGRLEDHLRIFVFLTLSVFWCFPSQKWFVLSFFCQLNNATLIHLDPSWDHWEGLRTWLLLLCLEDWHFRYDRIDHVWAGGLWKECKANMPDGIPSWGRRRLMWQMSGATKWAQPL